MNPWRTLLTPNQQIILFVQGQVFFILGLAIVWQSRRHSQLDLARSLSWLGAFGLIHALYEWGNLFIPLQAPYLDQAWIEVLLLLQAFLLVLSFAALFQFGAEVLSSLHPSIRWIQTVPAGLLLAWMTAFLWTSQVNRLAPTQFVIYADVWARYLLGTPGALAAALGLLGIARRQRSQVPEMALYARAFGIASLALAAYAILVSLVVLPAPFFPASVINADTAQHLVGLPIEVWQSMVGLVLVIAVVHGLEIFQIEVDRRFEEMELAHILMTERERISRELHDGAIQTVYTAGLLVESVRKRIPTEDPLASRLDDVISALNHAIGDLRQFVDDLEPSRSGQSLATALHELADDSRLKSLFSIELQVSLDDDLLLPAGATHVRAIVNEALSNIARHAHASHAWIAAERCDGELRISIADDGIGIAAQHASGFGLRNMRDRARLLGGTLHVESRAPRGTQVRLTIPLDGPS